MHIEHVNSRVKHGRIVRDTCHLREVGVCKWVMEGCGALHNFRVR
jgi:hypothetical protein